MKNGCIISGQLSTGNGPRLIPANLSGELISLVLQPGHASSAPLSLDVSEEGGPSSLEEVSAHVGVRHGGVIATSVPSMLCLAPGSDNNSDAEDESVVSLGVLSSGVDNSVPKV